MSAPADDLQNKPHLFQPGQSGNPKGRAKGSRNKLGEAFLADLHANWEEHGAETIEAVRVDKPDVYLKVVASILPRDLNVNVNNMDDKTDEELIERMRQLDEILGPFLASQGEGGDSEGNPAPVKH